MNLKWLLGLALIGSKYALGGDPNDSEVDSGKERGPGKRMTFDELLDELKTAEASVLGIKAEINGGLNRLRYRIGNLDAITKSDYDEISDAIRDIITKRTEFAKAVNKRVQLEAIANKFSERTSMGNLEDIQFSTFWVKLEAITRVPDFQLKEDFVKMKDEIIDVKEKFIEKLKKAREATAEVIPETIVEDQEMKSDLHEEIKSHGDDDIFNDKSDKKQNSGFAATSSSLILLAMATIGYSLF
ncbi:hypothetical protein BdWA1_002223 [Babesia duncani]|uniref:Uncharacterized protein n=1 Tax=Babesia duncani TaxID=323732 RepID=A0AAD9UPE0_9APIC|nr:hypothetical protein BdWA1_002223 [Babesia duncani]